MKQFKTLIAMMLLLASVVLVGCSDDNDKNVLGSNDQPTLDIVETAAADGRFTTLLAAAQAADLVDALKGPGPLTVFAPTDEAFGKLPAGTVEALLQDTAALAAILTYHVVVGEVSSTQVITLDSAATLNGQSVNVTVNTDGTVMIDNATIIIKDIQTSNGIIHVIDEVILPTAQTTGKYDSGSLATGWGYFTIGGGWISKAIKDGKLQWLTKRLNLYTVAQLTGLSTLTTAIDAAGLKSTVKKGGTFTILAPTNEAFAALPEGTIPALLQDIPTLTDILLYHVIAGAVKSDVVVTLSEATMVNGDKISINFDGTTVMVNDSKVIVVDIPARNGVIHLIDGVLLPPTDN